MLVGLSYLDGSLPFGFWIGKLFKGQHFDIRDHGANNTGFANVLRVLGWKAGLLVFAADFLKGFVPVLIAVHFFGYGWGAACLLATILGHAHSLYFYIAEGVFSGGTSTVALLGGMAILHPLTILLGLCFFLIVLSITRYLSLASMLSCIFVTVLAFALHFGSFWQTAFLLVTILILYTHRRNIGRLIEGIEPTLGDSGIVNGDAEVVTAFVIHSLTTDDLRQLRLTALIPKLMDQGHLTEHNARWLIANAKVVLEAGEIVGIETTIGKNVRVPILGIALLPDQIKSHLPKLMRPIEELTQDEKEQWEEALQTDQKRKELLEGLLRSALVQAQRRGAKILGLGALLSSESRGGADLQKYADQRGLTIKVDNGAAFTAVATIIAIERECPIPLTEANIIVIGAYGLIGNIVFRYLKELTSSIVAVGRDPNKLREFGDDIRTMVMSELFEQDNGSTLARADVIVLCTSSETQIITVENVNLLKYGALVVDVAIPPDFDDAVLKIRDDIKLVRSGLILLPGQPTSGVDFHFGYTDIGEKRYPLVPACLAQSILLGLSSEEEIKEHVSLAAKIKRESLTFFRQKAKEHGLEIITSDISEPALFSALQR